MNLPAHRTLAGDSFSAPPPATIDGKVLGQWTSIDDLVQIMRKRADDLNVTRLGIDEGAGLPSGYAGKVLSPKGSRSMGVRTMELMIVALGMTMVAVENAEATQRYANRLERRKCNNHANNVVLTTKSLGKWRDGAFKGNPELARRLRAHGVICTPAKKRKKIAKHAAKVRWAKHRAAHKATKDKPLIA